MIAFTTGAYTGPSVSNQFDDFFLCHILRKGEGALPDFPVLDTGDFAYSDVFLFIRKKSRVYE